MTKIIQQLNDSNQNDFNFELTKSDVQLFKHKVNHLSKSFVVADSDWVPISAHHYGDSNAKKTDPFLKGQYSFIFSFPEGLVEESKLKNISFLIQCKKTGHLFPVAGGISQQYDHSIQSTLEIYNDTTRVFDGENYLYPGNGALVREHDAIGNIIYTNRGYGFGDYTYTEDTFTTYGYGGVPTVHTYRDYQQWRVIRNFSSFSNSGLTLTASGTGVILTALASPDINDNVVYDSWNYAFGSVSGVTGEYDPVEDDDTSYITTDVFDIGFFDSAYLFSIKRSELDTIKQPYTEKSGLSVIPDFPSEAPIYDGTALFISEVQPKIKSLPHLITKDMVDSVSITQQGTDTVNLGGPTSYFYTRKQNNLYEFRIHGAVLFETDWFNSSTNPVYNTISDYDEIPHFKLPTPDVTEEASGFTGTIYNPVTPQDTEIKCLVVYTPDEQKSQNIYV